MRPIYNKIKAIFLDKYQKEVTETFKKEKLSYNGLEADCWACGEPIHKKHRSRKLNGNKIHIKCFKILRKIMRKGAKSDGF